MDYIYNYYAKHERPPKRGDGRCCLCVKNKHHKAADLYPDLGDRGGWYICKKCHEEMIEYDNLYYG